jgi:hypothetical protein
MKEHLPTCSKSLIHPKLIILVLGDETTQVDLDHLFVISQTGKKTQNVIARAKRNIGLFGGRQPQILGSESGDVL